MSHEGDAQTTNGLHGFSDILGAGEGAQPVGRSDNDLGSLPDELRCSDRATAGAWLKEMDDQLTALLGPTTSTTTTA